MAVSSIKAVLACDVQTVWGIVTSLEEYGWRSDLERIEVLGEGQFIEYTKDGFATTFTVTAMEPCRRWEFDMENENMRGHWRGLFAARGERTEIEFTEDVAAKKALLRPFVKMYLRRQQAQYLADLQAAIKNHPGAAFE